jgi:hypothetical protein
MAIPIRPIFCTDARMKATWTCQPGCSPSAIGMTLGTIVARTTYAARKIRANNDSDLRKNTHPILRAHFCSAAAAAGFFRLLTMIVISGTISNGKIPLSG